jgi:hypothetical protein
MRPNCNAVSHKACVSYALNHQCYDGRYYSLCTAFNMHGSLCRNDSACCVLVCYVIVWVSEYEVFILLLRG